MRGITLIELCVALSILAILAAVMLPRMAELQRVARRGELRHLHGQVSTRVMLAHMALQVRRGQPDAQPCTGGGVANNQIDGAGTLCTEHGLIRMQHGYPAVTPLGTPGVVAAAGITETFNPEASALQARHYRVRIQADKATFMRTDADQPEQCSFTYTQASDAKTAASISVPLVSGC